MNIGSQFAQVVNNLKSKNQMIESRESDRGTLYNASKFTTTIDGNTYTVASYSEVSPNWKDSGPKGDYLNVVTVTDKDNNKIAELSATYGDNPSFILSPKENTLINFDKLTQLTNSLDTLPKKENSKVAAVISNIQSIRENSKPEVQQRSPFLDWK